MNTFAYDKNLPCRNPACKSHGQPHPNCRCYGYAKGGEVAHFCSENRPHNPDCQYYEGGGEVSDLGFIPDAQQTSSSGGDLGFVPDEAGAKGDNLGFVPDEQPQKNVPDLTTSLEQGFGEGFAGPLATLGQKALGIRNEDIVAAREAHPIAHGVGQAAGLLAGYYSGVGELGLLAKGAGAVSEAANLGRIGSAIVSHFIQGAGVQGADEITKAMIGAPGSNPETPVGAALLHTLAGGVVGAGTAGVLGAVGNEMTERGLQKLQDPKVVQAVENYLVKVGKSGDPLGALGADKVKDFISSGAGLLAAPKTGYVGFKAVQKGIEKLLDKAGQVANPYVADAVIKAAQTNEVSGLPYAIDYAMKVTKGSKAATKAIEALFQSGVAPIVAPASDFARDKLKKYLEQGGPDAELNNSMSETPVEFHAEGGEVGQTNTHPLATIFPEQNMLMSAAKLRVANHLNSIRPSPIQQKMPFDDNTKNKEQHREYEKAVDMSLRPLSILDRVNDGSLTAQDMKHFTSMFPESHEYLKQELTKRITKAQMNDEKPSYKKRQAMSLFLGANLDSSLTPAAIQAAQGSFQQQAPQPPQKTKGNKQALGKMATSYQTDTESRVMRSQKG